MRAYRRHRPVGWAPVIIVAGGLAVLLLAGCGLRKAPRPYSSVAPAPASFQLRQYGDEVLVSWRLPPESRASSQGGLRSHLLWLDELAPGCPSCAPLNEMRHEFEVTGAPLLIERDMAYYRFLPARRESGWRARAAFRFGKGEGRPAALVVMPGLSTIPRPGLRWDWFMRPGQTAPETTPQVRLSWEPVQERTVHVVEAGTPPGERVLYYRANVYARALESPWRVGPVNAEPVAAATWVGGPSRADLEAGRTEFEYAIRWVDGRGGEGPLSDPLRISFATERAR